MTGKIAKLTLPDGKIIDLPIQDASIGQSVINISGLYKESSMFTFDPGFLSTASCESKITFIGGEEGILKHRGYSIEELAQKSEFLEVSYLLINGDLPKEQEYKDFRI